MPLSTHDWPNSYIGRSVPRPNARRLDPRPRHVCGRHSATAPRARCLPAQPLCPCGDPIHRRIGGATKSRCGARRHRRRDGEALQAVGWCGDPHARPEIGTAIRAGSGPRALAGRAGGCRRRTNPRPGRRCGGAGRDLIRRTRPRRRHGDRARSRHSGDPRRSRR